VKLNSFREVGGIRALLQRSISDSFVASERSMRFLCCFREASGYLCTIASERPAGLFVLLQNSHGILL
jgi:hypothetical protein